MPWQFVCPACWNFDVEDPFCSRWIFDVEILARLITNWPYGGRDPTSAIYEFPLDAWRDVGGSKLTHRDFVRAAASLVKIAYRYAPGRRQPKILRPVYPLPNTLDQLQQDSAQDSELRAA